MPRIAIIPARGGSKRIPRKNIKHFLGKPIIVYSIEAALSCNLFDEVMVSTDDAEIAEIAKQNGANVPFLRSAKNADDFATTVDVLLEVLQEYKNRGKTFEEACCIYSTAPFVSSNWLIDGYKLFSKENYDSLFPVVPFSFPIQRAIRINDENKIELLQEKYKFSRSQDLEKSYHDTGQFYWFKSRVLKERKTIWTENSGALVLSEMHVHDIDTMEDWRIAEFKYKLIVNED